MITLLAGQTGNAVGVAIPFTGGQMGLIVSGTLTSGTIMMQMQSPDGSWVDIDGGDIIALSARNISLPPSMIRAKLVSVVGSLNVYLLEW